MKVCFHITKLWLVEEDYSHFSQDSDNEDKKRVTIEQEIKMIEVQNNGDPNLNPMTWTESAALPDSVHNAEESIGQFIVKPEIVSTINDAKSEAGTSLKDKDISGSMLIKLTDLKEARLKRTKDPTKAVIVSFGKEFVRARLGKWSKNLRMI